MITAFYSLKGGSGVSVAALLYAMNRPADFENVLVVDWDNSGDLHAMTGFPDPLGSDPNGPLQVGDTGVWICREQDPYSIADYDLVIYDMGNARDETVFNWPEHVSSQFVVSLPCYVALRHGVGHKIRPDGVIVRQDTDRALRPEDVASVFSSHVAAVIPTVSAISRAIDAGLFGRGPRRYKVNMDGVSRVLLADS